MCALRDHAPGERCDTSPVPRRQGFAFARLLSVGCRPRPRQSTGKTAAATTSCLGGVQGAPPDAPPPHIIIRCDRRCCTLPRAHRSRQARSRDARNGFQSGLLFSCAESTVLEVRALAALAASRKTRLLATTPLPARPRLSNYLGKFVRRRDRRRGLIVAKNFCALMTGPTPFGELPGLLFSYLMRMANASPAVRRGS